MAKSLILTLLLTLSWLVAFPAEASFCRSLNDRSICILSIKRSAKYHWEYRAAVSINGIKSPVEIYNCRDRFKIQQDKTSAASRKSKVKSQKAKVLFSKGFADC
jgi:hypothetical protein